MTQTTDQFGDPPDTYGGWRNECYRFFKPHEYERIVMSNKPKRERAKRVYLVEKWNVCDESVDRWEEMQSVNDKEDGRRWITAHAEASQRYRVIAVLMDVTAQMQTISKVKLT